MIHRASLASLKKLSSESNYGGKNIWVCHEANIYMAREVFFYHVRRIHMSEFDEGLKEPRLSIKERSCDRHVCYYHECRDLLEERFRFMIDFLIFMFRDR